MTAATTPPDAGPLAAAAQDRPGPELMGHGTGSATTARRTLVINAVASALGFTAQLVVAFFLSPVLVHGLGDTRYGVWSLVESILAYLVLLDLGVAASVVRYVARFEAKGDIDRVNRIVSTSLSIFGVAGALGLALAAVIAYAVLPRFDMPAELAGEARGLLLLLGVNLGIGLPLSVFPAVLDGLGRYVVPVSIRTTGLIVRSAALVVVVRSGGGLVPLGSAITICTVLENLAMAGAAWAYLPRLRFGMRLVDRETFRTIRGYTADAALAMLAGRISFQTDAIVIGWFLAPEFITFFAIAGRLVEYAKGALRSVTATLTPAFSVLEAHGDAGAIRRMFLQATRYALWLVLPVEVGLLVLGRPFLARWMGPEYVARSYPVLVILAVPLGLAMSQSVTSRVLYGTSRVRWYARAVMAEAVANLVLSVALVRGWGIEGVALGTAVPNVLLNVLLVVYICRLLGVRVRDYLRASFLAPATTAAALALAWIAAVELLPLTTWPRLFAVGGAGAALVALAAALVEVGPGMLLGPASRAIGTQPAEALRERTH